MLTEGEVDACVLYEKRGRVARITLNRPTVLNALDLRIHERLADVWTDFEADPGIWVGVLGADSKSLRVGQDLKELGQRIRDGAPPSTFGARSAPGSPRLTERFSISKPLIARANGYAFGGGFELALSCDIIVATELAYFALLEAKLGLIPGSGGVFRLTRQIPMRTAPGYLMTGRRMSARRAYELGLVNEVVPEAELDRCVDHWVEDVLRCAALSVRAIKQAALESEHLSLPEAFAVRYERELERLQSANCEEGPLAFVERRKPIWRAY